MRRLRRKNLPGHFPHKIKLIELNFYARYAIGISLNKLLAKLYETKKVPTSEGQVLKGKV